LQPEFGKWTIAAKAIATYDIIGSADSTILTFKRLGGSPLAEVQESASAVKASKARKQAVRVTSLETRGAVKREAVSNDEKNLPQNKRTRFSKR
jgi:hypothetical protein